MREPSPLRERAALERQPMRIVLGWLIAVGGAARRSRMLTTILAIALGAAAGANLRYGVSIWAVQQWGTTFPYGTMLINVAGSFLIGLVLALATTRVPLAETWRLLIVTGFLGGFTTFSTFSYETYTLLVSGSWLEAGLNILGSVGLGMLGIFLGAGLARIIP